MENITEAQLIKFIGGLGRLTGRRLVLNNQNGAYQVGQIVNAAGGEHMLTTPGTKRETYYRLLAFREGFYMARETAA